MIPLFHVLRCCIGCIEYGPDFIFDKNRVHDGRIKFNALLHLYLLLKLVEFESVLTQFVLVGQIGRIVVVFQSVFLDQRFQVLL